MPGVLTETLARTAFCVHRSRHKERERVWRGDSQLRNPRKALQSHAI